MSTIFNILTTSKGWVIRQAAKAAGLAGVWLATEATNAGATSVTPENATGAVLLLLVGGFEILLSFLARKSK